MLTTRRPFLAGTRTAVAVVMGLLAQASGGTEAWPQWRGPGGQGHAADAHDLPLTLSETENVAWKTPLPGRGWSSPVIDA